MKNVYLFIFTKTDNSNEEEQHETLGLPVVTQEYRTATLSWSEVISYIMHYRERNPKFICTSVSIITNF